MEHRRGAGSVCTLLLSQDNLLTGYFVLLAKDWFMLHKKFNQNLSICFLSRKEAAHKNYPRTHSPKQNKKTVLTAAAYFKVSTPVRSQR